MRLVFMVLLSHKLAGIECFGGPNLLYYTTAHGSIVMWKILCDKYDGDKVNGL